MCRSEARKSPPAKRATLNKDCDVIADLLMKADELLAGITLADAALERPVIDSKAAMSSWEGHRSKRTWPLQRFARRHSSSFAIVGWCRGNRVLDANLAR